MSGKLERRAAMATLLADRGDDLLVVPGLGSTTYDLAAAGDDALLDAPLPTEWDQSEWEW